MEIDKIDFSKIRFNGKKMDNVVPDMILDPTEEIKEEDRCIKIDDIVIGHLGQISTFYGAAKSRKTYAASALAGAALCGKSTNFNVSLPPNKRRVVYIDTEQGHIEALSVMKRIMRIANLVDSKSCENFQYLSMTGYPWLVKMAAILHLFMTYPDIGLIIIDGYADLVPDINDHPYSALIVDTLQLWAKKFHVHICGVLHQNKVNNEGRGHLGTELTNRSQTVMVVEKHKDCSTIRPKATRGLEFKEFSFCISEDDIPTLVSKSSVSTYSTVNVSEIPDDIHKMAMLEISKKTKTIQGYQESMNILKAEYCKLGYNMGNNKIASLKILLVDEGWLLPTENSTYTINALKF